MQRPDQSSPARAVDTLSIHVGAADPARAEALRAFVGHVLSLGSLRPAFVDAPDQGDPVAPVLILQTTPAEALALALEAGVPAPEALAGWRVRTETLLAFFRQNRRRVVIAEDTVFLADPGQVLRRLGLSAGPDTGSDGSAPPELPAGPDPLARILGAELLRRDPAATSLAGELEASAVLVAEPGRSFADIETALARHAGGETRIAALEAELTEGRQKQDTILQQLIEAQSKLRDEGQAREEDIENGKRLAAQVHQLRQGLESAEAQLGTAQESQAGLEREKAAQAARIAALETELAEEQQEQDTVLRQLIEVQSKLREQRQAGESGREARERLERDIKKLREDNKRLDQQFQQSRQQIEAQEAELHRIYASYSLKITAPMRWVRRVLTPRR